MITLPPLTPAVACSGRSAQAHCASESLLDLAEQLLLHRSPAEGADLEPLIIVFGSLVDEARQLGDQRVVTLASSSRQLLTLLQARRRTLPVDAAELLLDAVDRIQVLLRHQSPADPGLHRSLERRILALST